MDYRHDPYRNMPPQPPQVPYGPPQPPPNEPTKTTSKGKEVLLGCSIMLVGLVAMGGCLGAVAGSGSDGNTSDDVESEQPSEEPSPTEENVGTVDAEDPELDEWTEMVFELTWADMSPREQDELCMEVEYHGAEHAARIISEETSTESGIDQDTVESILTDYCL